jgi:SAM-dependent methyltransferase
MSAHCYPRHFYMTMHENDGDAPARIVDCILSVVQPKSVIDVGCGVADFLAQFMNRGIVDVTGVDLAIDTALLQIPQERFTPHDLSKPFKVARKYDLVVSLETAEHLPESAAETFVDTLVNLGDVVVFSAAVPEQDGFRHINLQWQDYWADRFRARGFVPVDCIRDRIWTDETIPSFYRQNILMYVRQEALPLYPSLAAEQSRTAVNSLSRIHPSFYMRKVDPKTVSLKYLLRALPAAPRALVAAIRRRVKRLPGMRPSGQRQKAQ